MRINREPIGIQIANDLETRFLKRYSDGESIPPIQEICEEFNVSRSVVREALKILETRGLIDIQKGKKATIKPIASDILAPYFTRICSVKGSSFHDLIDIVQTLELRAIDFINEADEIQLSKLNELYSQIECAEMGHDFEKIEEDLHDIIIGFSGNTIMKHLVLEIRYAMKNLLFSGRMAKYSQAQFDQIKMIYLDLCNGISENEVEASKSLIRKHYNDVRERYMKL